MTGGLRGKTLKRVKVTPLAGAKFEYGFYTPDVNTTLGQAEVTGTPTKAVAFSPRNVKPGRATKRTASGITTSFVNAGSVTGASQAGFKCTNGKSKAFADTKLAKAVCIKLGANIYYGWMMKLSDYNALSSTDRTKLGILSVKDGNVPLDEIAVNANGFVLPTAFRGFAAGTYISRKDLRVDYPVTVEIGGENVDSKVSAYAGVDYDPAAPAQ